MEMDKGVNKAAATAARPCALGIGAARILLPRAPSSPPAEATPTLPAPVPPEKEKEPEAPGKCYKKTVGEDATFLETAKDYLSQFMDMPAKQHWLCIENSARAACGYVSEKTGAVFGRKKVEPVVKDDALEEEKPAPVEPVVKDDAPEVEKPTPVEPVVKNDAPEVEKPASVESQ